MGIVYDPMTGEPFETPDEETNNEVKENADASKKVETSENNEAAATENSEAAVNNDATVSDKVESVFANDVTASESNAFTEETTNVVTEDENRVTYEVPMTDDAKSKKPLFIAIGVAAVLVIAIICCLIAVFSSKKAKVVKAINNTFDIKSQLGEDIVKANELLLEKESTLGFTVDIDELGSVKGAVAFSDSKKQLSLDAYIDEFVPFNVLAQFDENSIKAEIPQACEYVFTYNYRDDKDGYLVETVGDDTIEEIDKLLQYLYDYNPENEKYTKELTELVNKYAKELEFENAGKETFKVDGEKVDCKGISVLIENDLMEDFFDEFNDIYMEMIEESLGDLSEIGDLRGIEEEMKDLKREVKNLPDTEITFYIYKNALACISVDTGKKKNKVDILFKGGDFRAQNISVENRDEELLSVKINLKDGKETYKLSVEDEEFELTYNTEKGDVVVSYYDGYDSEDFEFNLKVSNNDITVTFDELEIPYAGEFNMVFTFKKGADFAKFENKEEFDIGNASDDDIMDLVDSIDEDFSDEIYNLF